MTTPSQERFLTQAKAAAKTAGHPWPAAAAAEAALESGWGRSSSAREHNNLLGIKPPSWWQGATFTAPTTEVYDGRITPVVSGWAGFASWEECFACQVAILNRNKSYAPALAAKTPEGYILAVSKVWATDPNRGPNIVRIYRAHKDLLEA